MFHRCPICKSKVKKDVFCLKCLRCGWFKLLEPDNLTKRFLGML